MKKYVILLIACILFMQSSLAITTNDKLSAFAKLREEKSVTKLINSQVKYANKTNFEKFIDTYDKDYINSDGFDLETYSALVKDIWNSYAKIKYNIKINNIEINGDKAIANVKETSYANLVTAKSLKGELKSEADSIYYLKKINGKWKVTSDNVIDETTTMLYGDARNLDIKLTVPQNVKANTEYSAMLEFNPPANTAAIASLAADKVEYPQKQTKEVFRALPEDHILERLFTANDESLNEYIVASIGLTQTDICDISIKLSLTGFGYVIKRVNVEPPKCTEEIKDEQN